ncbi:NACHT domain-containing protein [Donghicola sp. C2-DW-16]|uniref:NACHT domain-containing protein n=1 Tax=Donghicola mangrovi TaxID=2729614 RepID=A0ABX2PJ56_9RHOB|nr:NACHT domain-containing protein [Donghicola mangrovi]NVO29550.1 NACHT domain-containing protein [Donghicola mangrovi]
MKFNFSDDFEFEAFVRKVASECWGATGYSGARVIDGKERDGVLENDNQIFCIEVTTAKSSKHTSDSCKKLESLVNKLRSQHPDKGVTGWYITRYEATGDQGAILSQYQRIVNHRTYEAFYANIVDAKEYLIERDKKSFGSIRGPQDGRFDAKLKYTPTKILDTSTGESLHTGTIAKKMSKSPFRGLIVGEFGAGKSMALRDIFQKLSHQYRTGQDSQFPVYVNLRDHIEQFDPDECLRRHASSVGMKKPENLIKAWRSGLVYLILDGFDELAPRIATNSRKRAQDLRRSAISLVRRLIDETPVEGSILLAGRNNYFDSDAELHSVVGIKSTWKTFEIHDLDNDDLARFISDHGWEGGVPDWVPKKPLLISYIKQNNFIEEAAEATSKRISDPASGWDFLVDKICEREVDQVYVALEPAELRQVYCRLATYARRRSDRRGPMSFADCRRAFVEITGVEPEERSVTAILRLPGLSGSLSDVEASDIERGSRYFVDPDLADCLSAGDVEQAIRNPYVYKIEVHEGISHSLGELGRSVVYNRLGNSRDRQLSDALRFYCDKHTDGAKNVCSDLINIVFSNSVTIPADVFLTNIYFGGLNVEGGANYSSFTFDSCGFENLSFDITLESDLPNFQNCQATILRAPRSMEAQIDTHIAPHNSIDNFDYYDLSYDTLRKCGAPEEYLDLISIIDKAFVQSTKGRQLGAMYRGRPEDRRSSITRILETMSKEGWVSITRRGGADIVVPNMSHAAEAKAIIARKDYSSTLISET